MIDRHLDQHREERSALEGFWMDGGVFDYVFDYDYDFEERARGLRVHFHAYAHRQLT